MGGSLSDKGDLSIEKAAVKALDYFLSNEVDETTLQLYGYDGEIFRF